MQERKNCTHVECVVPTQIIFTMFFFLQPPLTEEKPKKESTDAIWRLSPPLLITRK